MIEHIVLFRWKPDANEQQIADAMDGLRGLPEHIPGVESLTCGADFTGRAQGYTHGLVARFTDKASLAAYSEHPTHLALIKTRIIPIVDAVLDFDFEVAP